MALIIAFPGVAQPTQTPQSTTKPIYTSSAVVRDIRGKRRVPKGNRSEDAGTIMVARLAKTFAEKAYVLAQTEPDSDEHRKALHMARMADRLPEMARRNCTAG